MPFEKTLLVSRHGRDQSEKKLNEKRWGEKRRTVAGALIRGKETDAEYEAMEGNE